MSNETVERIWRMTRLSAGSYLLPSNDRETLWHISSFTDGRSGGLDEPDRKYWKCSRYLGTFQNGVMSAYADVSDYGYLTDDPRRWRETDSYLRTRADAIAAALDYQGHRERCAACQSGYPPCPHVGEAIDHVVDWFEARRLLSRAQYLRAERGRMPAERKTA